MRCKNTTIEYDCFWWKLLMTMPGTENIENRKLLFEMFYWSLERERMKMIFELSPPQTNPVVVMNNKKLHRNKLEQEEILQGDPKLLWEHIFIHVNCLKSISGLDKNSHVTCLQNRWVYIKLKIGWGLYSDQCSGLTSGDSNLTSHSSSDSDCLWLTWETHFIAAV